MDHIALIMAAGEGQRMKSDVPKLLHELCGKPMLCHVMDAVRNVCEQAIPILGHGKEEIVAKLGDIPYAVQDFQTGKGTGHAVQCATRFLAGRKGCVVVTAGDMPLVTSASYRALFDAVQRGAAAALLYDNLDEPFGYGRVIMDQEGHVHSIVEQKDLDEQQQQVHACNASVYCFDIEAILWALPRIENHNAAGEYYLTDAIGLLAQAGYRVAGVVAQDHDECRGINTRVQLLEATEVMRSRIQRMHMLNGVTLIDAQTTYIDTDVTIGRDTVIYPNCTLQKGTAIGARCTLLPNCRISASDIGDEVQIESSVILESRVKDRATVGPFAYLRPGTVVGEACRIGDFVELKNSTIGRKTKISHLTYVGDSDLGEEINVGCGVVFVNYDGKKKFRSRVGDHAFIGCNANLVAPVEIGAHAYIAAGSTITEDVPEQALSVARARQVNKAGWVEKRREAGKI